MTCWRRREDVACHRHRRSIGAGTETFGPLGLTATPEILRANRLHHRLIRRHGRDAVAAAFDAAARICGKWHDRYHDKHDDDFQRLLRTFHGPRWTLPTNHPTVHAAYPQVVALTRLLSSPHWLDLAMREPPERDQFLHELRRTVAPRFKWRSQIARGGPYSEPLIEGIRFQQQLRDQPELAALIYPAPDIKLTHEHPSSARCARSNETADDISSHLICRTAGHSVTMRQIY